jgi:pimeloyl-ACP methyl ester carboxylesterase
MSPTSACGTLPTSGNALPTPSLSARQIDGVAADVAECFIADIPSSKTYSLGVNIDKVWAPTAAGRLDRKTARIARSWAECKKWELQMKIFMAFWAFVGLLLMGAVAPAQPAKPTIILVHGAFADSSSWYGVIAILERDGYSVIAAANPLRSVKGDADTVRALIASIHTPVVLVGHSYGGMVISNAANRQANVKALVYVAAFAPESGENAGELNNKFPGSLVGPALAPPVPLPGGGHDLYVQQEKFHDAFAPDVPAEAARLAAAAQRPVTDIAFSESATEPAWKTIPSWFVYGDHDTAIPPQLHAFMTERARPRATKVVEGASHVVMISHSDAVAKVIEDAATAQ